LLKADPKAATGPGRHPARVIWPSRAAARFQGRQLPRRMEEEQDTKSAQAG
jgi:hypothetical protein